jgi:hypothetical protein
MSPRNLISIAGLLAFFCPSAAMAEDISSIFERVEKERHLAMIDADISSDNARTISLLGRMTYEHRICGDGITTQSDITEVWLYLKSGPSLDDVTMKRNSESYANALEVALAHVSAKEKDTICLNAKEGLSNLKQGWGLQ